MKSEIYEKLRERLDRFPLGAPAADEAYDILATLFTEEEARIALDLPPFPESIASICEKTGMEKEKLVPVLDRMSSKGLVFSNVRDGVRRYSLLPMVPGIFELQFMKGEYGPEKSRLAKLFDEYYVTGWGKATFDLKTSWARVIPVEKQIPAGTQVFTYEKASELIENASSLALTNCFCRHEAELLGKSCGAPKDVCMILGPFADFTVERGFAERASKQQMMDALARSEEAGLVHCSDNCRDRINFICNCCGCCCGILGSITKLNIPTAVATSRYIASIDEELCDGCGTCVERCHVSALSLVDDVARHAGAHRCIGCGLCASACPSDAIAMIERPDAREPKRSFRELITEIAVERGKFGA
ncbi:MAG: 4Fe-4S binding protein [bacterium]